MKLAQKTIMVVEDEAGIREITKMYLTKKGYNVILASDGEQALKYLNSTNPHLVLLDIEMPGKDGFEVCKEIRKKDRTHHISFCS